MANKGNKCGVWEFCIGMPVWAVPLMILLFLPSFAQAACQPGGLTATLVGCTVEPLREATKDLTAAFYKAMRPAIATFLLLSVAGYGLKMTAGGVRRPLAETGVAVAKLASVVFVIESFPLWYPEIMEAVDDLLRIITQPFLQAVIACPGIDPENVWQRLDCMLGAMFGLGVMGAVGMAGLGLLGEIAGNMMQISNIGIMVAVAGIGMGLTFILAIGRAIVGYLGAAMIIAFLVALAPLFMPLIMLKGTYTYFNKWFLNFFSYVIQPVFLFAYVGLTLNMMDYAVFRGDYSIATVLMGRPAVSIKDFQQGIHEHQSNNTCGEQHEVLRIHDMPEMGLCERVMQNIGIGERGEQLMSETVALDCDAIQSGAFGDAIHGFMRQMEGVANIGVGVAGKLCDDQMGIFLLIQFMVVFMIAFLMFMFAEVVPDMARDLVFSPRVSKLGTMEVPGESILAPLMQPDNISRMVNSLGTGNKQ